VRVRGPRVMASLSGLDTLKLAVLDFCLRAPRSRRLTGGVARREGKAGCTAGGHGRAGPALVGSPVRPQPLQALARGDLQNIPGWDVGRSWDVLNLHLHGMKASGGGLD
jgi:hypothetical protein